MNLSLNQHAVNIHKWAASKGWWDDPDRVNRFPELIALAHSELSEALEEWRESKGEPLVYFKPDSQGNPKPEGLAIEIIDTFIRLFDTAAALGIDLDAALQLKMAYNETRPIRHGGKYA